MPRNFTKRIFFDGRSAIAAIIPEVRQDGTYYEVNIKGFPRFYMTWSALGRYDIVLSEGISIPYDVELAVSDAIEEVEKKK